LKKYALLLIAISVWGFGQHSRHYDLPKYSPSYHRSVRDVGPKPDSKVVGDKKSATFKRIYAEPAALRLLVRAECSSNPGEKELIDKARQMSSPTGPPVQIDWNRVTSDKVTFYAVVSTNRKVVRLDLSARGGKYEVTSKNESKKERWEVRKLTITRRNLTCVKEKDMTDKELRIAVVNFLNHATLNNARRPSTE
jgi:hypothetical protein